MNNLILNVAELLRKPGSERAFQLESTIEALGINEDRLPPGAVQVNVRLDVLSDGVVVSGTVHATWKGWERLRSHPVIIDVWMSREKHLWYTVFSVGDQGLRGDVIADLKEPIDLFMCDIQFA